MVTAWGTTRTPRHIINMMVISIHVPAWGTTRESAVCMRLTTHFNPRSRVGNDVSLYPTLLSLVYFNPRSRVGNDFPAYPFAEIIQISIHVPAWGTTAINADTVANMQFQSTFPRGERQQILTIFHLYIRISNPNLHFNITPFHIFYLIHFFWACFFQLFMVRIFWGFSVYFWFALYRNNT